MIQETRKQGKDETKKAVAAYLNERYEEARKEKGGRVYSISAWARDLSIEQASISKYINGQQLPEGENLIRLIAVFGRPFVQIMANYIGFDMPPRLIYVLSRWNQLSEEESEEIAREVAEKTGDSIDDIGPEFAS